jgi:hypothetical protein
MDEVVEDPVAPTGNVHIYVTPGTDVTLNTIPVWFLQAAEDPLMALGAEGDPPPEVTIALAVEEHPFESVIFIT